MNLSDLIENYIVNEMSKQEEIELRRGEIAQLFNCVPSQVNYVLSTRFIPELGYYVESRRGGGGYIKICKINLDKSDFLSELLAKTGDSMSKNTADVYLRELQGLKIIDEKNASIINAVLSDKSLNKVDKLKRDKVRADIFKNILVNLF